MSQRTMKAIRLIEPRRPLELREVPIPTPGPDDVLVRVKAAGICHSDAHYRAGVSPVSPLPMTLGHEVAGIVAEAGSAVDALRPGDRVCLHYLATCGNCLYCHSGHEQFCTSGSMIGKYRDGGYAEYICVPARSAFLLPDTVSFEHGAVMMCSSATSLHALRKARLQPGESVAIFGVGGLGMSAVQIARAFGALDVYAVDIVPAKLDLAARFGAIPVDAKAGDPVAEIKRLSGGRSVDVALDLIGLPQVVQQAIRSLAVFGRAVAVGLSNQTTAVDVYRDLIGREGELIGASDHLASELPTLIELARRGLLDLSQVVSGVLPLEAGQVNAALDRLEQYGSDVRLVIAV